MLAGADDYVAKPFNARELIARGMSYTFILWSRADPQHTCSCRSVRNVDSWKKHSMPAQRNFEYYQSVSTGPWRFPNINSLGSSPDSQTHPSESSDAKRTEPPLLLIRHGMKCRVILLEETRTRVIGVITLKLNIGERCRSYGKMSMPTILRRCILPSGGSRMVDGVSLFFPTFERSHADGTVTAYVAR